MLTVTKKLKPRIEYTARKLVHKQNLMRARWELISQAGTRQAAAADGAAA